jgi:cytochrome c553
MLGKYALRAVCAASLTIAAAMPALAAQQSAEDGGAFFEKNIRPILIAQCTGCHSAASNPVMGGLRLDDRAAMLKGGSRGPAVVPGNPGESLLMKAVLHTAGALKMPPGPKMKAPEAAMLAQWIQMGAPWGSTATSVAPAAATQKYWAFVPPRESAPPKVKQQAWVRNPVDAFLLAELEAKGLTPAKGADKRTLIRRATYDLTGLPPTPAEVQAFLNDSSPDAYAKVIDRLLASPRYGERWARHWLDVARYADSNGLDENLVYKNAFRYRDYVIAAFNKDKPFDQFVREQIAGDLMPTSDLQTQFERWTATGFLSLGAKMLAEDDPVKMEMDIVDEQLDTTMRAFSGLTIGCARCHNHKFDPIPQADYYAMAGIFKSSKTMENFKVVAKWHEYVLAPKEERERLAAHEAKIEAKRKEIGSITKGENDRLANEGRQRMGAYLLASAEAQRDAAVQVAPVEKEAGGIVRAADSFVKGNVPRKLEKKKSNTPKDVKGPYFAEYTIEAPEDGEYQIDVFDEEKGAGTADLWVNGAWEKRGADPVQNREASPETGGWTYVAIVPLRKGANTIRLEHASRFPYFEKLLITRNTLAHAPLTMVQIARKHGVNPGFLEQLVEYLQRSNGSTASPLYAWEILGAPNASRTDWASPVAKLFANEKSPEELASRYAALFQQAEREGAKAADPGVKALYEFLHEKFGPFRAPANARRYYAASIREQLQGLDQEAKALEAATPDLPKAMGVAEGAKPADLAIHLRGSHWNLGAKVPRGFVKAIGNGDQPLTLGEGESGRLQLAQWLTSPEHPLTARVIVNRLWRWHFGRGIVPSVDNFGRLGEKPSNQPLLDWLAVEFVKKGWSMKAMHRTLMLSNAYQMSSTYDARAYEADPSNILLWRFPRQRLEAEEIRDGIMTVSGGLKHDFNGGSILKYKDRQYVANTSKGGDVDYDKEIRAVYIPVVRSSLYDVFRAFDLPDPATSNGDRDATVVAPQALFMMNSSVMLQHSRKMADRLMREGGADDASRIREAYEAALSRPPTPQEIDQAQTYLARMEQEWKGDRTKAWQSFCKSLLASNEFIYIN